MRMEMEAVLRCVFQQSEGPVAYVGRVNNCMRMAFHAKVSFIIIF